MAVVCGIVSDIVHVVHVWDNGICGATTTCVVAYNDVTLHMANV